MENLKQYKVIVSDKAREVLGEIIAYIAADSLQNANHCRPTVFVYIEVAFKCRGEPCMPASNGINYMLKQIL